jgi:hypothetical protein
MWLGIFWKFWRYWIFWKFWKFWKNGEMQNIEFFQRIICRAERYFEKSQI